MPSTHLRQTVLASAKHLVVKLGTQLLTDSQGKPDVAFLQTIANQIRVLNAKGYTITLVASGAIGAGCGELGLTRRPRDVAKLQAVAAVGQPRLMNSFHEVFARHDVQVAQLLLTRADLDDRTRYLNFRNCVQQAHRLGCIPIINENDSVAVDEICFGDNDLLAALACNALRADALVLLTMVDGLLDEKNQRIDLVENAKDAHRHARTDKTALGTGGIGTKLQAAHRVTEAGEIAIIANGREPDILLRLLDGEKLGTVFVPAKRKLNSRSRWIGLAKRPAGCVQVDDGAATALCHRGKSLLATGITEVQGSFTRGQALDILNPAGQRIARGLTNYPDDELRLIMGKRSNQFQRILGRTSFAEVIHRDNLVLIAAK